MRQIKWTCDEIKEIIQKKDLIEVTLSSLKQWIKVKTQKTDKIR